MSHNKASSIQIDDFVTLLRFSNAHGISEAGATTAFHAKAQSGATLKRFAPSPFEMTEVIGSGALVEVDQEGEICFYLLAPTGGGLMTEYLGCDVTVVTPDSRLYQGLIGKKMGDELEKTAIIITGVE
ncbi:hypothetical protein OAG64_05035 [Akkermansiaceae bacterium]|nr:hypothetical protein [Akkermansiaceae bacterium]